MREDNIGNSHKFGLTFHLGRGLRKRAVKQTPTPGLPQRKMKLKGRLQGNVIHLDWDPIAGSDGYLVYARLPGKSWRPLHYDLFKKTNTTVSNDRREVRIQFQVKAVVNRNVVAESNVVNVN